MYKNIINFTIAAVIMLLPLTGMAAPQTTDIKKPTRERVKEKDDKKNANDKKSTNDKKESNDKKANNDKKEGTKDNKTPTTVKKEATPAEKPGDTKPADANQNVQKTVVDTANKNAAPPKPKKVPMYPDKVQFDGIDISKHQGEIDWAELKKQSKIQYVYIRATVGSNVIDNKYKENFRNARKHGFKAGSYHYFTNLSSATAQFENFIKTVDRNSQDLLPIIDVEEINRWSKQQLRDSVMVFARLVEDYFGCKPLIYTNEKFFTTNLGRAFAEYPLFIAKYSTTAPNIGYNWVLWQFSDCGQFKSSVKGNHGEVDLSRFNKGRSINDILYVPSKHKPKKVSAMDAVEQKEKPATVKMTEQKPKEAPKTTKRQQDDKKQAEKEKKLKERNQKAADELAKKKAEEQRKAKEKEEQRKKAEQQKKAREDAAKKAEAEKQRKKAEAKQARQDKAKRDAASKSNKPASLMQSSASKLSQSQRNDSIRNAKLKGQKINKSTPDND
ncbi:MAG: hypothetical protein IJK93_09990 [Muribaculaceae bacterium]|nr:hypothetical protein [Muribaculaceae bacterium]